VHLYFVSFAYSCRWYEGLTLIIFDQLLDIPSQARFMTFSFHPGVPFVPEQASLYAIVNLHTNQVLQIHLI